MPKNLVILAAAASLSGCATTKLATPKQCEQIFEARQTRDEQALDELRQLAEQAEEPVGDEPISEQEVTELKKNSGDRGVFVRTCSQLPTELADCFRPEAEAAVCEERLFEAQPKQKEVYEAAKAALAESP